MVRSRFRSRSPRIGLPLLLEVLLIGNLVTRSDSSGSGETGCRCLPGNSCWEIVPWSALNASVRGRLHASVDELASCIDDIDSDACTVDLKSTDDEFWVSAQPNGYLHTGLYNRWNITTFSSYFVAAETEQDFQATVKFAKDHNLRLVVKGTGHDWYGRSTSPGSLMLWTHKRKDIAWHDDFVATGCEASTGVPAVTVQSGVQFRDLYPDAQAHGKVIMGGTCDSVGVGGCWMAGCYGPFTKKFGNGAVNILSANVVLANGTLVTASKCSHPDLFWSIRGGGGGVAGVVTEFTARSHPTPAFVSGATFHGTASTEAGFQLLLTEVLRIVSIIGLDSTHASDGGMKFGRTPDSNGLPGNKNGFSVSIGMSGYEANQTEQIMLLQPLLDFVNTHKGDGLAGSLSQNMWNKSQYDPASPKFPWMETHPDREISTSLIASMTRYFPQHYIAQETGRMQLAEALVNVSNLLPRSIPSKTSLVMFAKGQSGLPSEVRSEFEETAQNPVLLDTVGSYLAMYNIPELPQLAPSSKLLNTTLWPRLQEYAMVDKQDPLFAICQNGADGNETGASECLRQWHHRIPQLQLQMDKVRQTLQKALPNVDEKGKPFSGAYWCETDYEEPNFQDSHWGSAVYARLLKVKQRYDPTGLFICHHCVGSEFWTAESNLNCRVQN